MRDVPNDSSIPSWNALSSDPGKTACWTQSEKPRVSGAFQGKGVPSAHKTASTHGT